MTEEVAVLGGGGHAKVVISTLRAAGFTVSAVYDDADGSRGRHVLGVEVRGPLSAAIADGARRAVIAIGSNEVRKQLATSPTLAGLEFVSVVHPHSYVDPSVRLDAGTVVFAGAVLQPECKVGQHVIVNTGATVDHDSCLHDFSQVCPGAHLAGNVTLEEGVFIATGATLVPGVSVGAWSTVGAGAAVLRDLPAGVKALGVPARPRES